MKAYKIWFDTKHFIHKDTTDEINVSWTTNINDALDTKTLYLDINIPDFSKACRFFNDTLGFSPNISKPDALYFL